MLQLSKKDCGDAKKKLCKSLELNSSVYKG